MIYTTPAVVLATTPDTENNPWIGYHTVVTFSNLSSDTVAEGFPVTNVANVSTAEKWRAATDQTQGIIVHEGGSQECDYLALARHNLGSSGTTLKVQTSPDAVTWTDASEEIAPATDYAIMYRFEATTANYWRVLLTPPVDGIPEISILFLGKLLVLQRRIYVGHTPLTLGRSQNVTVGRSDNGQFLGLYLRSQTLETSVALKNLTPDWYRTLFDPFAASMASRPFFFAWRPDTYPEEVGYAWNTKGVDVSNQSPNGLMQVTFPMEGIR